MTTKITQVDRTVVGAVAVSTVCVRDGRSVRYLTAIVGAKATSDARETTTKADAIREHDHALDVVRGYEWDSRSVRVAFYRAALAEVA